jgi:hypothetical protein
LPLLQNSKDVQSHQLKKKKRPRPIKRVWEILEGDGRIEMTLGILTVSEANCSESWRDKHARHKIQKAYLAKAFMARVKKKITMPCQVTMVRFAPGLLDAKDNLRYSLKWIADGIAEHITGDYRPGRADDNKEISWHYGQEKSKEYYVKIIIESSESP